MQSTITTVEQSKNTVKFDALDGDYVVESLGKTFSTNFLTGTLCGLEDQLSRLFQNGIYWRKKLVSQIINKHCIAVTPNSVLWVTIALVILNVCDDLVSQVRSINTYN